MSSRPQRRRRGRPGERDDEARPEAVRTAEPSLEPLVAEQLLGRGGEAARIQAARSAQRAFGNHAVSRVLARDENPALEQKRTVRPPKQKLRTGREVDAIFETSPYFKDLVGAKLKKVTLDKTMKLDDEADFETAWIAYAMRSYNPKTKANYTEQEAKDFLKREGVRAFQDEDRGEIHIRKDRSDLGTQLHEGLHLFSHDRWKRKMRENRNVNEGVTEFFTRKIGPEVKVERDDNSFLREYTSATHLVAAADEQIVASAYFSGDVAGLKKKIDDRKGAGAGTFEKWIDLLESNDFKGANKLMQQQQ